MDLELRLFTATALALLVSLPAGAAKKNDPDINLRYLPQQTVADVELSVSPDMRARAFSLRVIDARGGDDPSRLGTRTDDDDRLFTLRAVNEVVPFVEETLSRIAREARLEIDPEAGLQLVVTLTELEIEETNQAVGATFESQVRLDVELEDAAGELLWSGTGRGDATRYGKKFSNENCNEVLSDALLEAFADTLNERDLQTAWATGRPVLDDAPEVETGAAATASSSSTGPARSPQSPAALLTEVEKLMAQGFDADTLLEYVRQGSLNRRMGVDDMTAWKQAGVPEAVIREALKLPVR